MAAKATYTRMAGHPLHSLMDAEKRSKRLTSAITCSTEAGMRFARKGTPSHVCMYTCFEAHHHHCHFCAGVIMSSLMMASASLKPQARGPHAVPANGCAPPALHVALLQTRVGCAGARMHARTSFRSSASVAKSGCCGTAPSQSDEENSTFSAVATPARDTQQGRGLMQRASPR